ncbi:PHP-associated domain-containing protein [Candidatus Poribacteria bacterium]
MNYPDKQTPASAKDAHTMRVDLHVHCKERSNCGKSWAEEQIVAAMNSGLDAIVFTDHNRLVPDRHLRMFNEKYAPFRIFGGIEVSVEDEHVLVLGVNEPCIETTIWRYSELHKFVHERGGYTALAHPFRYRDTINIDLESFPTDAIEVASNNTPEEAEGKIRVIASYLGIPVLCNSDSHICATIGKHYNIVQRVPTDEMELIHLLRAGEFQCSMS